MDITKTAKYAFNGAYAMDYVVRNPHDIELTFGKPGETPVLSVRVDDISRVAMLAVNATSDVHVLLNLPPDQD
ncbi:hypothetical protein [Actinokineospora globicatena]|uniref:Uncharacterized protein n=1 Tax=Actinokineospora globicatena TaxID=103729 RepID=A0A9W6QK29_9PSEU|nr:hypothetical protein [Actinokineospora globicatena]MCP2301602.1 hypothetical protein [Actinokineospora globicatena]GLW76744.1 hypothetical protein Aglo01_12260 [Actinokineospora globicatena]GLW83577.1 hypothetical protein Aglo02_12170 [Actinokineospora globicatena]GLW92476.1 hypothetical protein Aglo03_32920 [Actinokineospora globicatena]